MRQGLVRLRLVCLLLAAAPRPAAADEGEALAKPHLVEIAPGRRLNMVCVGAGSPTVVFEQGAGSNILHWKRVEDAAARLTRACFYDRAGNGYSDPPDRAVDAANVTDDLHALLHAGWPGPVVLVGHSVGGLYATLYADRFPQDVAGLVLVDPAVAGQYEFAKSPADQEALDALARAELATLARCRELALAGPIAPDRPGGCAPPGPPLSADELAYMRGQTTAEHYQAEISEFEAAVPAAGGEAADTAQERAAARDFGDLPLVLLAATRPYPLPGLSDDARTAFAENEAAIRKGVVARSSRGEYVPVPDSGHFIQFDQPSAVIQAVGEVVAQARRSP